MNINDIMSQFGYFDGDGKITEFGSTFGAEIIDHMMPYVISGEYDKVERIKAFLAETSYVPAIESEKTEPDSSEADMEGTDKSVNIKSVHTVSDFINSVFNNNKNHSAIEKFESFIRNEFTTPPEEKSNDCDSSEGEEQMSDLNRRISNNIRSQ